MRHLLDVNVALAALINTHPHHDTVRAWLPGKSIVLCPVTELGFLRISTNRRAYGLPMSGVRQSLERFAAERKADRVPADLNALDSRPKASEEVTDHYLADLAKKHGLKLATLDERLDHPSAELISG